MLDGSRRIFSEQMPGGAGDLTLAELQEMASRQQQQMDAQQQVLVAKEQRLKYLRQQEARHAQLTSEGERIRKMRERVESQELKLKKLRALRGQAEMYKTNNGHLNGELDAVKAVFNEKEKELALAVARVDRLNRQLQDLRANSNSQMVDKKQAVVSAELDKLRKELLMRNKLNEQQSNTISAKEKMLAQRREEVARMDSRIHELQQRLKKRQVQELQMRLQKPDQTNKAPQAGGNVATVEPYIQYAPQNVAKDDLYSKMSKPVGSGGVSAASGFNKQDPKYQTMPARVKSVVPPASTKTIIEMNNNTDSTDLIEDYQLPTVLPNKSHHNVQYHPNSSAVGGGVRSFSGDSSKMSTANMGSGGALLSDIDASRGKQPSSALQGAGDFERPGPVLNIHEEERQAASGQSSPASSEASSGGIQQVRADSEINTSSIGPVSAVIDRLNKGGLTTAQAQHSQDRSVFTQRGGKQRMEHPQPLPPTSTPSTAQQQQHPDSTSVYNTKNRTLLLPNQQTQSSTLTAGKSADSAASSSGPPPPHLNQKPAPTYRYASKNQIANTYMGRLGSGAMDKYQKNLNQIYKSLDSSSTTTGPTSDGSNKSGGGEAAPSGGEEAKTSFSNSSVSSGKESNTEAGLSSATDHHHPQFGVVSSPGYPDIASDKGSFKLNTPKQVRRRHSDSENEDLNKALQERQEIEQQDRLKQQQQGQHQHGDLLKSPVTPPQPSNPASSAREAASSGSSKDPSTLVTTKTDTTPPTQKPNSEADSPSQPKQVKAEDETDSKKVVHRGKSNLKKEGDGRQTTNRVSFDPLALLLDASLEGELDLVKKVAVQVDDVSTPNDEGITALHNAICAGHYDIVKVLVEFGCDVNSPDSDGWTPLHCAASCNNLPMVRFLVEHGACVFATTISDQETAADKCEEDEDGYDGCSDYLYSIQEKLGITNNGEVYGVFDYQATKTDELSFQIGDKLTVIRKGDDTEKEWWWSRLNGHEGYIPRNMLGLHPRVMPGPKEVSDC